MKTGGGSVAPGAVPAGFRGEFSTAPATREAHRSASGVLRALPSAVAAPADAADVQALVAWASDTRTPLIPRAAATGMPGGNVGTGVLVDMMRRFVDVRVLASPPRALVEPGVTRAALNAAAAEHGLHLPVDPSSGERCSIGGMIANNAAGAHSVLHGATRAWVESLDVVLADGSSAAVERGKPASNPALRRILRQIDERLLPNAAAIRSHWPRVRKNSSGYALREYLHSGDAVDLLVGSEGTLALVVGARLRLAEVPRHRGLAVLEFGSLDAAAEAVQEILEHAPATCEMLDRTFLELVRSDDSDPGYPLHAGIEALLFVEMEDAGEEAVAQRLEELRSSVEGFADAVTVAIDPDRQKRFWQVRHAASPIIARLAGTRMSMQFIEDSVVPIDRVPDYVRGLRAILSEHDLPAVIFGHAGDGNLHVNPLVDTSRENWRRDIERVLYSVAALVTELGGTLAGEHGDGRLRAPLLEGVWGSEMVGHFRAVKDAFDPLGILNPGVILPLPRQRPLELLEG